MAGRETWSGQARVGKAPLAPFHDVSRFKYFVLEPHLTLAYERPTVIVSRRLTTIALSWRPRCFPGFDRSLELKTREFALKKKMIVGGRKRWRALHNESATYKCI